MAAEKSEDGSEAALRFIALAREKPEILPALEQLLSSAV